MTNLQSEISQKYGFDATEKEAEFIKFLEYGNIQAQVDLNKLGGNAQLCTFISTYIKKNLESKDLQNGSINRAVYSCLDKLREYGAITENNHRILNTEYSGIGRRNIPKGVDNFITTHTKQDNLDIDAMVLDLFNQNYIAPLETRVGEKALHDYHRNLSERKEIFNKIQLYLKNISQEEGVSKSDKSQILNFIKNFEDYREGSIEHAPSISKFSTELQARINEEMPVIKNLNAAPKTKNPFETELDGIYHKYVLAEKSAEEQMTNPADRLKLDQSGSKNLLRAVEKIIKQYGRNFDELRDVARIRHTHTDPDLGKNCSFFMRNLAPKYDFELVQEESNIKSIKGGTTKAKEIYKKKLKKENGEYYKDLQGNIMYMKGEVQYSDERQIKWDKKLTHSNFGTARPFFEGAERSLSLDAVKWGDLARLYDMEDKISKLIKGSENPEIQDLYNMSPGLTKLWKETGEKLKALRENQDYSTAPFNSNIRNALDSTDYTVSYGDMVKDESKLWVNPADTEQFYNKLEQRVKEGIEQLNMVHLITVTASYEKAHPVDRAIYCALVEKHIDPKIKDDLLSGCRKGLKPEHHEKAKKYINHFNLDKKIEIAKLNFVSR